MLMNHNKNLWLIASFAILTITAVSLYGSPVAFADGIDSITEGGLDTLGASGGGQGFGQSVADIAKGFRSVGRIIILAMTGIAGVMVAFGLGDAKKNIWNYLFGVGLVLNAADILWGVFGGTGIFGYNDSATGTGKPFTWDLKTNDKPDYNFLGPFMIYYKNQVIIPGCARIAPYAARLCVLLSVINMSVKAALQLIEGDKLKFIITQFLTTGIYCWLIYNWTANFDVLGKLSRGFESLGYLASDDTNHSFGADSIVGNAFTVWDAYFAHIDKASLMLKIVLIPSAIILVIMLFLISLEMLMARIEYWTMALLTLPLLAFGVLPQLKFLSEKAIGAMFNLAIKVMCIAFMTKLISTTIDGYVDKMVEAGKDNSTTLLQNIGIVFQFLLLLVVLFMLVHKVPQLIQGLLSGNPSLASGDMVGTAKSMASSAANTASKVGSAAGGAVAIGGALAGAASGAGGGMAGLRAAGGLGGRMAMSALKTAANQTAPMRGLNKTANALVGKNGLLTGGNPFGMNGRNTQSAVQALKAFTGSNSKGGNSTSKGGNNTSKSIDASKGSTTNNSAFSFGNAAGGANGGSMPGGNINPGGNLNNGGGGGAKNPHTTVSKDTQTSISESVNNRKK